MNMFDEGVGMSNAEAEEMRKHVIISEPRKTWLGRVYRQYTVLPEYNIYREFFTWREYGTECVSTDDIGTERVEP